MHTVHEKKKLVTRVRRIRGQLEAVERALEAELGCTAILQQVAAARGALTGLVAELIEEHIRSHVLAPAGSKVSPAHREAAEELIDAMKAYVK